MSKFDTKKLLSISIIILAISIIFSSVLIEQTLIKIFNNPVSNIEISNARALLTMKEATDYLNIPIDEFKNILDEDSKDKLGLSSYPTYRFIPYMEIGSGNKMFSKQELDQWVKYNMINK